MATLVGTICQRTPPRSRLRRPHRSLEVPSRMTLALRSRAAAAADARDKGWTSAGAGNDAATPAGDWSAGATTSRDRNRHRRSPIPTIQNSTASVHHG